MNSSEECGVGTRENCVSTGPEKLRPFTERLGFRRPSTFSRTVTHCPSANAVPPEERDDDAPGLWHVPGLCTCGSLDPAFTSPCHMGLELRCQGLRVPNFLLLARLCSKNGPQKEAHPQPLSGTNGRVPDGDWDPQRGEERTRRETRRPHPMLEGICHAGLNPHGPSTASRWASLRRSMPCFLHLA